MQEDFLHYIWKHSKFNLNAIKTTRGESIQIISKGQHNLNSGPDFFNAQIRIEQQLWAGNVEIHVKSSDWFLHNHEVDKAYDNVILHVVWEHDSDVFRKDNSVVPTLQIKDYVSKQTMEQHSILFSTDKRWINCENDFASIDKFTINNWLERLYFERLERKSKDVYRLLEASKNDWEAVLFKMLAKNFGLKVNGASFLSISNSFDFSVFRKCQSQVEKLEALIFGQAGLLDKDVQDVYFKELFREYAFLKQKFVLDSSGVITPSFFRLRPNNFPTIRLSQLAKLYVVHKQLFSKLMAVTSIDEMVKIVSVEASEFWKTHYTFDKVSKLSNKKMSKQFIHLLIINTIIPVRFSYAKYNGKIIDETILNVLQEIPSEKNSVIEKFNSIKRVSNSALESQAFLQLKMEYCDKNKCLQCAIGNKVLSL